MKTDKLILIIIVGLLFLFLTGRITIKRMNLKDEFKDNLLILSKKFPEWVLEYVEKIYRLETAHFRSGQFKGTYSAGMEKFGETFPYGWNTINNVVWSKYPEAKPLNKFWCGTEGGTGKQKCFLVFPNLLAAMTTLAGFIAYYKNPFRWYSTNEESQKRYADKLSNIKTPWNNETFA